MCVVQCEIELLSRYVEPDSTCEKGLRLPPTNMEQYGESALRQTRVLKVVSRVRNSCRMCLGQHCRTPRTSSALNLSVVCTKLYREHPLDV